MEQGRLAWSEGRPGDALELFLQAAQEARSGGEPEEVARALNNACVAGNSLGRYETARKACEEALEIRLGSQESAGANRVVATMNNLALALEGLGETDKARELLVQALERNRASGDLDGEAANLNNLGKIDLRLGRYGSALEWLRAAELLTRDSWQDAVLSRRLAEARLNLAVLFERVGSHEKALETLDRLLAGPTPPDLEPSARLNRAVVLRNLGDLAGARREFERAQGLHEDSGDVQGELLALMNRAQMALHDTHQLDEARSLLVRARKQAEERGDPLLELEAAFLLGEAFWRLDNCGEARRVLARTRELAQARSASLAEASALFGLARCDRHDAEYEQAQERLEQAGRLIEALGDDLGPSFERQRFLVSTRRVTEELVALLLERARQSPPQAARKLLRSAAQEVERAKGRGPLAESEGARVLSYLRAEGRFWLFVSSPPVVGSTHWDVELFELGWARDVERLVEGAILALHAHQTLPGVMVRELSEVLLPDSALEGSPEKRLLISPDGVLHRVPFALLTASHLEGRALVEDYTIRYHSSFLERERGAAGLEIPGQGIASRVGSGPSCGPTTRLPGAPASRWRRAEFGCSLSRRSRAGS